jgi:hypothetical protein
MNPTNRSRWERFVIGLMALASVAVIGQANARSVPASVGRAVNPSDSACFSMNTSTLTNVCSTVRRLELPLTMDTSGWKNISITARGPSAAGNVVCDAVGTNADLTSVYNPGAQALPRFGSPATISLRNYVWSGGRLFAACNVYPGGAVYTVSHDL